MAMLASVWVFLFASRDAGGAPLNTAKMHPLLADTIARPLRYWPVAGDFVITNGPEFFNRPLYCVNSPFRIDGGDKPQFSLYLPGRGGNLRFGIKNGAGAKWLDAADVIVTRYRAGSLIYQIQDPLLGGGELELTVLPRAETRGLMAQAELRGAAGPVQLVFAFGGVNGMRGKRGGDIGCENEPVSQFFQLRPEQCRDDHFSTDQNAFFVQSKVAQITGCVLPPPRSLFVADAQQWGQLDELLKHQFDPRGETPALPVMAGLVDLATNQSFLLSLEWEYPGQKVESHPGWTDKVLPDLYSAAQHRRAEIAGRVAVETPDPFINAAVPALNIAADAIWDDQQRSFMHGAVAWRTRLLGWRGPYAGDVLGWHERTAEHFAGFARAQNIDPVPDTIPSADQNANLSRNETALHSNGDLTHSHYDMNLVGVDAFFRHLLWTGDTNYAAELWPVIERHLAWEHRLFRREFGADQLPLYEAYAAIWASDNLSYDGGGAAHASAYNYFENQMAARVAKILGQDPAPYEHEAELILRGMNQYLWLADQGEFAESKDYLGLQQTHDNPALWTFYTTVDCGVPTSAQAWQMSSWVDEHIAHIPIHGRDVPEEGLFTLPSSNWLPYQWSLNNVVMAEAAHTSLAYWEANRPEAAFALFKGELLDSMFLGLCPGNLGAMTAFDSARGEAQRDFGDAIGINARALVEGLFGVKPDALAGELKIVPGFPAGWRFAKMSHPDFNFGFRREDVSETYEVESKFPRPMSLVLDLPAYTGWIGAVMVNGAPANYRLLKDIYGVPRVEVRAEPASKWEVRVEWRGNPPAAQVVPPVAVVAEKKTEPAFDWGKPFSADQKFEPVSLTPFFNDRVTQIFKHEYRSPRSPFCSLAMPGQGIGGWADDQESFEVEDSGLRAVAAQHDGRLVLPDGLPLATPADAGTKNIIFTSQWDNYPREVSVPVTGKSPHVFLLMAGSTGPLQSQFNNGEVVVTYADGTTDRLALRNPVNWWPIDQDYFTDDFAFRRPEPMPPRVDLATGKVRLLDPNEFKGHGGRIRGGAATVLDLPLNPEKELKSLTVRALANEVVIGLMAITLERE